jgi:hypothetical protein
MASGQRSALSAAVLIGGLLAGLGPAQGVTEDEAPCTRGANLVVVDLDDDKHRHIIDHALNARRKGHPRVLHIRRYKGLRAGGHR